MVLVAVDGFDVELKKGLCPTGGMRGGCCWFCVIGGTVGGGFRFPPDWALMVFPVFGVLFVWLANNFFAC